MNPKLLIIIPYRNRASNLEIFIPHINDSLQKQNIPYSIVIVEQSDHRPFNRGLLSNAGFKFLSSDYDYICIHDVDIIGETFDYSYSEHITHLAARQRDRDYTEWYDGCIGGATLFPTKTFASINGFSNKYWGWGCEDDDLRIRCAANQFLVTRRQCKYYQLFHSKSGWENNHNDDTYHKNRQNLSIFENIISDEEKKRVAMNDGVKQVDEYIKYKSFNIINNYTMLSLVIE